MEIIASVIVIGMILLVLVVFAWSNVRGLRTTALRPAPRAPEAAPDGLHPGLREPEALRSAFALTASGELLTAGRPFAGTWRGGEVALIDLVVRTEPEAAPLALTVATVDVEWRWPWMRLRTAGAEASPVDVGRVQLDAEHHGPAAGAWILEAADASLAVDLVTPELLAWLGRLGGSVVLETTPRHLLVAVPVLADADLGQLFEVATGVIDHVPVAVRERIAAPPPRDEYDGWPGFTLGGI